MLVAILFFISIGAFIISRIAGEKAKSIPVCYTMVVDEGLIGKTGLYQGLAVKLIPAVQKDVIDVFVNDASGKGVCLGSFNGPIEYDILKSKKIDAFIHSINSNVVTIEVKLYEAL